MINRTIPLGQYRGTYQQPNIFGYYGNFGGAYIPEMLHRNVEELKSRYTIAIVTHNLQQAARVSDFAAFLYLGQMIEFDTAKKMFESPSQPQTIDYIKGRFG